MKTSAAFLSLLLALPASAALLDSAGICIRSGHHCTQPLHRHYGISGSARASLSFTTTAEEIDRFAEELEGSISFLREHS